jgi:hypothetical protein
MLATPAAALSFHIKLNAEDLRIAGGEALLYAAAFNGAACPTDKESVAGVTLTWSTCGQPNSMFTGG